MNTSREVNSDLLACPHCLGVLERTRCEATCRSCDRFYPCLRGIPDLRTADDEYLINAADWEIARRLDSVYDQHDFRGLLDVYYDLVGDVPIALRERQIAHILSAPARAAQWMTALGTKAQEGTILDLGCGPAGFLASTPVDHRRWVGLDIAMRWLLLARKRLDEMGRHEVLLVCGCAESLPFFDAPFAGIVAGDVVEHVRCRATMLAESHRVLEPGGRLVAATPNRFSLAPEPHVGVWGVGFLPRKWMTAYVKLVSGGDFRAITTHGAFGWKRLARRSPFEGCQIVAPSIPVEVMQVKRPLVCLYNSAAGSRIGQFAMKAIGPLFHLVFEKDRRSTPATRPRSRRSETRQSANLR